MFVGKAESAVGFYCISETTKKMYVWMIQIINLVTDGGPNRLDFFTHFCKSHKKVLAYICKKQSMYTIVSPSSMQKITSYTNIMSV